MGGGDNTPARRGDEADRDPDVPRGREKSCGLPGARGTMRALTLTAVPIIQIVGCVVECGPPPLQQILAGRLRLCRHHHRVFEVAMAAALGPAENCSATRSLAPTEIAHVLFFTYFLMRTVASAG